MGILERVIALPFQVSYVFPPPTMRLLPLQSSLFVLLASFILLPLAACDSGGSSDAPTDDPPALDNAFSFTVTDEEGATRSLDGFAYFATGTDPETDVEGFVIYFIDDEDFSQNGATNGLFGLAVRKSGRPGPGSYAISTADADFESGTTFAMVFYEDLSSSSPTIYEILEGTIDVSRSESDRLDGTLSLAGAALDFSNGGEPTERAVTIEGAFRSPGVSSFFGTGFLQ